MRQVVKRLEDQATQNKRLKQLLARTVAALQRESVCCVELTPKTTIGRKNGQDESIWTKAEDRQWAKQRLEVLLKSEPDDRVKLWALARLTNQRQAELARIYGYRDGSGVAYAIRKLETDAKRDRDVAKKLARLKSEIYRLQS